MHCRRGSKAYGLPTFLNSWNYLQPLYFIFSSVTWTKITASMSLPTFTSIKKSCRHKRNKTSLHFMSGCNEQLLNREMQNSCTIIIYNKAETSLWFFKTTNSYTSNGSLKINILQCSLLGYLQCKNGKFKQRNSNLRPWHRIESEPEYI